MPRPRSIDLAGARRAKVLKDASEEDMQGLSTQGLHFCGTSPQVERARRRDTNVNVQLGPRLVNLLRRQLQRLDFQLFAPMLDAGPTGSSSRMNWRQAWESMHSRVGIEF